MLSRLKISNFALVDDVELTFDKGMSVLTGETGAGKSVIVAALGLVLGGRADREHIRHGATAATVEATFQIDRMDRGYRDDFADYFENNRIEVLRRINRDGGSKVKINGTVSTVARLKELASPLAEILGQHANRMLLNEENHLVFLDSFASVTNLHEEVGELFIHWEKIRAELKRVNNKREELVKERELLLFQQSEINKAEIKDGEEEELLQERRILDSSRALMESSAAIEAALDSEDHSAIHLLRSARRELDKMAAIDASLKPQVEQMTELDLQLEEMRRFVEKYGSSIPDDPQRLEEINLRLDEIYQLKQKYGGSEKAILDTLVDIEEKLGDRPDIDSLISKLEEKEQECREAYATKAVQLSEVRKRAANYLEKLVIRELSELAIDNCKFQFEFIHEDDEDGIELDDRLVKPSTHGLESGSFLFSANPGEPLKSLVKTASGGEISRVLLALKAAEKKNQKLMQSMMVFDEVDAGIGGQTAVEVGKKLKKLSDNSQVLVITHLHQIARLADHHYLARKTGGRGKRMTINVVRLGQPAIREEINRMVALPEEG